MYDKDTLSPPSPPSDTTLALGSSPTPSPAPASSVASVFSPQPHTKQSEEDFLASLFGEDKEKLSDLSNPVLSSASLFPLYLSEGVFNNAASYWEDTLLDLEAGYAPSLSLALSLFLSSSL